MNDDEVILETTECTPDAMRAMLAEFNLPLDDVLGCLIRLNHGDDQVRLARLREVRRCRCWAGCDHLILLTEPHEG